MSAMITRWWLSLSVAFALLASAIGTADIVFILADDLGYNELNFMNSTRGILTPHLDALADSGVVLKNYYVAPICSPTRSALMTGRYPIHLGTQSSVIFWDTPWAISDDETFLPQHMKAAGFATAMFGKWHLGMYKPSATPTHRGFDVHEGYYQGCESAFTHVASCCSAGSPDHDQSFTCQAGGGKDYRGYDWFKDEIPDLTANQSNSATLIRAAAVRFISQQDAATPFFMYLPFQNIHSPYTCEQTFRERYANTSFTEGERTMFGYLTEMDDAVGEIVAALRKHQRYNTSIVIFSSDNGAPTAGEDVDHKVGQNPGWIARNYPFRGHKVQIWEGGTRVAGFISGGSPLLPAAARGVSSHALMHITDWLPTLVSLAAGGAAASRAGAMVPLPHKELDGHDLWPALIDPSIPSPRSEVLYNINPLCNAGQASAPKAALRQGRYKLLAWCFDVKGIDGAKTTGPRPAPDNTTACDPEFKKNHGLVLYDLEADEAETTNLASDPALASTMEALLSRLITLADTSVEPQQWVAPYQGEDYECAHCELHPGGTGVDQPWKPWIGVCSADEDCQLNGVCTNSACQCAPGWTGASCAQLSLHPARLRPLSGYDEAGTSSWGGSVIEEPNGVFNMFVSRMAGHCGLNSWRANSEIIRATATDPEGPYTWAETAMPLFAHGPKVRRMTNGSYLMMHLGCGVPNEPFITTCANGSTPTDEKPSPSVSSRARPDAICNQFNVSVKTASAIDGPWSASEQVFLNSGSQPSWYVPSGRQFSNPSPHFLPNGSLICGYRADARTGGEHVSIATAAAFHGPYVDTRAEPAIATHDGEDPFLWQDERGHWHMLMHNMVGGGVGSHAFSRDGLSWTRSEEEPYTATVNYADGTRRVMRRRERPELILSEQGIPKYFISGVEDEADHTYTLVMKVV